MAQSNGDEILVDSSMLTVNSIVDSRLSRFDDKLIDRFFDDEGKRAIEAYRKQHELDARQNELDILMSAKVLEHAWIPELDAYYNNRIAELKAERERLGK